MRILLVTEDVPSPMLGGAGQHAVVLGNALIEAGHEVHLLGYASDPAVGDNGFCGTLHRGIDFRGARWHEGALGTFFPLARPHMARRIWHAIGRLPGPWDVVHYHGHNALLGTLVPASWNFVHTLHDQGAECITRTRYRDGGVCNESDPVVCAGCATRVPNGLQRWSSAQSVRALRAGARNAYSRHKAIFVSQFLRRRFLAISGVDASSLRTEVVHNFVEPHRLAAAAAMPPAPTRADARTRVFAAGRIDQAKGFGNWLDSMSDANLSQVHVVVAGDGPELAAIRARHAPRGVEFLGWCKPEQVLQGVVAADVCVVPSLCEEACATTVLEALALGRTVMALKRGGTPELSVYGEPGQLRLHDGMADLCAALPAESGRHWPCSRSAHVQARLPALLSVYGAEPQTLTTQEKLA